MTRRLALAALWVTATAFAVLLASYAVRLAGEKVVAQGPATVSRNQVEADLTSVPGSTAPEATTPPEPPAPEGDPTATTATTATPPGGANASGSGGPTTTRPAAGPPPTFDDRVITPTTSAGGDDPGGSPTTSPAPVVTTPPVSSEQSFPLVGGSVRMRCVGSTASLVSSSPNPGFAMEVRSAGPREVEVRFTATDHTSELKGSCADGQIVAEPKESGGGGNAESEG